MVNLTQDHPYLSGPNEDATCYGCGKAFSHQPTVVMSHSPAGRLLRLDDGEMVDVCDDCMDAIADHTIGNIYQFLESRAIDVDDSPALDGERGSDGDSEAESV